MLIPQTNLSQAFCLQQLRTYSPVLINYGSRLLPLLSPELGIVFLSQLYICPLCVKNYLVSTPDGILGNTAFSLEHLPPNSVGGRFKLLTCKKCNNDWGNSEGELLKVMNLGSIPDKQHRSIFPYARISHKETRLSFPVTARREQNSVHFEFSKAAKQHNETLKKFIGDMHTSALPLSLHIGAPDEEKIGKALLKSSYLLGFVWWGYEFVYSNNGELIRQVLRGERHYPVRVPAIWKEANKTPLQKGVSILQWKGVKQAFVTTLELKTQTEHIFAATLLPSPLADGWEKLSELKAIVEGRHSTETEVTSIPRTINCGGYSKAWELL